MDGILAFLFAAGAAWALALAAMLWRAGARLWSESKIHALWPWRAVPRRERAWFVLPALVYPLLAFFALQPMVRIGTAAAMPLGLMDSPGHPGIIAEAEKAAEENPGPASAFWAGYTRHMAGDYEDAQAWYAKAPGHAGAGANAGAARESRPPQIHATMDDAVAAHAKRGILAGLNAGWYALFVEGPGGLENFAKIKLSLLACLLLAFLFIPPDKERSSREVPGGGLFRRALEIFIPGLHWFMRGRFAPGYAAAFLAAAALWGFWWLGVSFFPATGLISGIAFPNFMAAYPMPPEFPPFIGHAETPSSLTAFVSGNAGVFPHVQKACLILTACLAGALLLHALALRDMRRKA